MPGAPQPRLTFAENEFSARPTPVPGFEAGLDAGEVPRGGYQAAAAYVVGEIEHAEVPSADRRRRDIGNQVVRALL
nr:hypothetical protein [Mycobacterium simiae]